VLDQEQILEENTWPHLQILFPQNAPFHADVKHSADDFHFRKRETLRPLVVVWIVVGATSPTFVGEETQTYAMQLRHQGEACLGSSLLGDAMTTLLAMGRSKRGKGKENQYIWKFRNFKAFAAFQVWRYYKGKTAESAHTAFYLTRKSISRQVHIFSPVTVGKSLQVKCKIRLFCPCGTAKLECR